MSSQRFQISVDSNYIPSELMIDLLASLNDILCKFKLKYKIINLNIHINFFLYELYNFLEIN